MYKVLKKGYIISKWLLDGFGRIPSSITYESSERVIWKAVITPSTCYYCASMNGRILSVDDPETKGIPVHANCKCHIEAVIAVPAGLATNEGVDGVDMYVALNGRLPDRYITQAEAKKQGWKKALGNLDDVLPGKIIGGDIYKNRDHRLPEAPNRVWHEADFNYSGGYRNSFRLLFSNDGLIFVTYDHYMTFYEIGVSSIE